MAERLRVRGAVRAFGEDAGLFGLDIDLRAGEIHALVGLNGAGKTSLMRAVLGMLRLAEGSIRIDGTLLTRLEPATWRRVGQFVERSFAYPDLTTRTNMELAARLRGDDPAAVPEIVDAAIDEFGLGHYAHIRARRLSQGNRQRLGIAAALQHRPSLIVLDEPTNALDPAGVILLRESLLRRTADGAGILVSSHHLDEVARIAQRISVLNHGRVVGSLDPAASDLERTFFDIVHADDEHRGR